MTRREQIMDAAMFFAKKNKNNPSPYLDFVEAAEWADRTMIEKACEWIQKEVLEDYPYIIWPDIVKDFRKAMEE